MVVRPHHSLATVPPLSVLLHPGGDGTQRLLQDRTHLAWLRQQREQVPLVTSVCIGSTALAAAGLLHQRPATSNRKALDQLIDIDPPSACGRASGTSMTGMSSPLRASPPASTWPCISSSG
jgi:putative intracellular protease/amidase